MVIEARDGSEAVVQLTSPGEPTAGVVHDTPGFNLPHHAVPLPTQKNVVGRAAHAEAGVWSLITTFEAVLGPLLWTVIV